MAKIMFVLGGVRSGKSAFAEALAKKYNNVAYVATAEIRDDEMRQRIKAHRARRPVNWKTIESPLDVDSVILNLSGRIEVVLIDCITLYVTNMLLDGENSNAENITQKHAYIMGKISELNSACRKSKADVIIVSNEVGFGVMPDNELSRQFLDVAGSVNQLIAAESDECYFIVAGIAQRLK